MLPNSINNAKLFKMCSKFLFTVEDVTYMAPGRPAGGGAIGGG